MAEEFEPPFVIGIDCGTQSVRAIAFDARGRKVAQSACPTPSTMHEGDRGEYDPDGLYAAVIRCLTETARALDGRPVAGMAVASIGESCVLVDEAGRALAPSLVWFDRRTEETARELSKRIDPARMFAITGMPTDPTFTLCKLLWMREHWPDAWARARHVLSISGWIAFRLCGEAAIDATLASRTLLFDIHARRWSEELLALAGLDASVPGRLVASGAALGPVRPEILAETGLAGRPVVAAGGHDHLVGSYAVGVTRPGIALDSIGTAEFVLLTTPAPLKDPAVLKHGFVQGAIATHRALSLLGGGINTAGGAIEWFRTMTGGTAHDTLIAEARAAGPGSHGVAFLSHLVFAPAPEPDTTSRGAFLGLTAHTTRGALYRAVLEGLALQARLMLDAMTALPGIAPPGEIRAIGGTARNALLMEIKASVFNREIIVVDEPEATSLGAALLGGVAAGVWADLDAARDALDRREHTVEPQPALAAYYETLYDTAYRGLQALLTPINRTLGGLDRAAGLVEG